MSFIHSQSWGRDAGLSATFRQWNAQPPHNRLRGASLAVTVEFETFELDERGEVVNPRSLTLLSARIRNAFDHTTLIAHNDPALPSFRTLNNAGVIDLVETRDTSAAAFSRLVYDMAMMWLHDAGHFPRVWVRSTEVREHGAGGVVYLNPVDRPPSRP